MLARLVGGSRRSSRLVPLAEAADLRAAAGAACACRNRHAVVGGVVGRAALYRRSCDKTAVPAGFVPLLRTIHPRHVGVRRFPDFLHAADGGVLAGSTRSEPRDE